MKNRGPKKKVSLRTRLILAFVVTSILPIIALNLFSYYNTSGIVKDNVNELTQLNLQQTKTNLDVWTDSYEDILFQIYTNDNIVELVKKINEGEDLAVSRNQLRRTLGGMFYTKDYIKSITVLTENGDTVFYDMLTGSSTRSSWLDNMDISRQELYRKVSASNDTCVISTQKVPGNSVEDSYFFHLGHRIINYKNVSEQLGIVVVSIDEGLLSYVCGSNEKDADSFNFIVDAEGKLVSYRDKELLGKTVISWSDSIDERQERYTGLLESQDQFSSQNSTIHVVHDEKLNWDLINVTNQNEVVQRLNGQQNLMAIALSISIGALMILILLLTNSLTGSINKMGNAMKQAGGGNLTVRVAVDRSMPAEVETIANQFNQMLEKLKTSMEKEKEAAKKQQEAEIAALEAQINPHFLYNTLDTINWMAIDQEAYEISNSIGALAGILRYGIDNSNSIVTVRQESEWLKQYLFLQQTRLKNTFVCDVHVKPELLEERIHKLLLQPFVENSILHGFSGSTPPHELKVEICSGEKMSLDIMIWDNGKGIPSALVEQMNSGIFAKTTGKNHIGMENAITRIRMYYGEEGKVAIESEENCYTRVRIRVPRIWEEKE